jgi:hypothetical protein
MTKRFAVEPFAWFMDYLVFPVMWLLFPRVREHQRKVKALNATLDARIELQHDPRGFKRGREIPSAYGGFIQAYESSAASYPHIWILVQCPQNFNEPNGPTTEAMAHLRIEDAEVLLNQLTYLINNHYQRD